MRIRTTLLAGVAALAIAVIAAPAAVAATGANTGTSGASATPSLLKVKDVKGTTKSGKTFNGSYTIQRFKVATVDGKRAVYAVGILTGTLNGQHVSKSGVLMPAKLQAANTKSRIRATTCPVLHLVLGPVNLNLLGLVVTLGGGTIPSGGTATQPITLNIDAQQGGGLLGDLLCGVTNALSSNGLLSTLSGQLSSLVGVLNGLLAALHL